MKRPSVSGTPGVLPTPHRFEAPEAIEILASLSQSSRLEVFRLLVRYLPYGLAAGDIARLLAVPHNTLSTHLASLEQAQLVISRREGRSIIYAANRNRALQLTSFLLANCCSLSGGVCDVSTTGGTGCRFPPNVRATCRTRLITFSFFAPETPPVLFLAEAILNREGAGRIHAFSAGSRPKGAPNPYALGAFERTRL